jgi:hypothetical protein
MYAPLLDKPACPSIPRAPPMGYCGVWAARRLGAYLRPAGVSRCPRNADMGRPPIATTRCGHVALLHKVCTKMRQVSPLPRRERAGRWRALRETGPGKKPSTLLRNTTLRRRARQAGRVRDSKAPWDARQARHTVKEGGARGKAPTPTRTHTTVSTTHHTPRAPGAGGAARELRHTKRVIHTVVQQSPHTHTRARAHARSHCASVYSHDRSHSHCYCRGSGAAGPQGRRDPPPRPTPTPATHPPTHPTSLS